MRHLFAATGFLLLSSMAAAAQSGRAPGCTSFQTVFAKEAGDLNANFVRPLVVSRGAASGDFFDLVTNQKIDGLLECRGETLVRFEIKIAMPADSPALARYENAQGAAIRAALGWSAARASHAVRAMSREADEYLRASAQRGDHVVAGKTENHEGGADLGMIWTATERTLVIVGSGG